jgi:serine/threonine protein kinase
MAAGEAPPGTAAEDAPLGVVAGYELVRALGHGGMAEVFLARSAHAQHPGPVVVKRMLPHLASKQRNVDLFLREARLASRLEHPNIVRLFEFGEDAGRYFLAMEFIDGVNLHQLARETWRSGQALPTEVVVRAIADAAAGLHHAHALTDARGQAVGLIHRDISPENLMMDRQGITRVLDFGIARTLEPGQTVTQTGELKGKIPYMSPEQIEGRAVDARTDLFSLGITFYWLLTGQRPFDGGSDVATIRRIADARPVPPSRINPHVPAFLDDVVLRLLEKRPQDRLPTAQALHDALVDVLGSMGGERQRGAGLVAATLDSLHRGPPVSRGPVPDDVPTVVEAAASARAAARSAELTSPASRPSSPSFAATAVTRLRPPGRRRGALLAIVGGSAASVLLALGGVVALRDGDAGDVAAAGAAFTTPSAVPAGTAPPPAPATPTSVQLRVVVDPAGARVFLDGRLLGPAPLSVPVPRDPAGSHQLRVEADGRQTQTQELVLATDVERALTLAPTPTPPTPAPPPSPPPRAARPAACDPPFFVDDRGIKTYKPECL